MSSEANNTVLVEQFMTVTGSDRENAVRFLQMSGGNLEVAVNSFLEADIPPEATDHQGSSSDVTTKVVAENIIDVIQRLYNDGNLLKTREEEEIRAPIPQKRAVLVDEQYHALPYIRNKRAVTTSVFDRCRDFKKETEEKEKYLSGKSKSTKSHLKRLHELFRPPVDIIHQGDFQSARNASTSSNKWLLVNIQNTIEFACQVLNRDVWSDQLVREILVANFILWQVYHDSDEGMHYQTFYPVKNYPHLAVIDPRTGESMAVWENLGMKPSADQIVELATMFLSQHSLNSSGEIVDENTKNVSGGKETSPLIDKSEDMQLQAALKASLQQTKTNRSFTYSETSDESSDHSDGNISPLPKRRRVETTTATTENNASAIDGNETPKINNENGETSPGDIEEMTLLLRLPNNTRKQISFDLDKTIEELKNEICFLGFPSTKYELIKSFPRTNISTLDCSKSLRNAGFHKQETIFVQER